MSLTKAFLQIALLIAAPKILLAATRFLHALKTHSPIVPACVEKYNMLPSAGNANFSIEMHFPINPYYACQMR